MKEQQWTHFSLKTFLGFQSHLKDQEVPSFDQDAELFQLLTVFGQAYHLVVDAILRGGAWCTCHMHIKGDETPETLDQQKLKQGGCKGVSFDVS